MAVVAMVQGRLFIGGAASGEALAANAPFSFWGGYDPETGSIIDQRHDLAGEVGTGRVLVIPSGRGSCSGSGVLLEAIVNGTAPAAIITSHLDPIISLGCVLGDELRQTNPTLVVVSDAERRRIATGDHVAIDADGWITVSRN